MTFAFSIAPTARRLTGLALMLLLCACGEHHDDYYPLEGGRWWYFETRTTILDEVAEQRLVVANIGEGALDNASVRIQRQSSGREVYIQHTGRGLERIAVRIPVRAEETPQVPSLILPADRTVGSSWTTATRLRLIESRTFARQDKLRNRNLPLELVMSIGAADASVTVPAGTFTHCIRIDGNGIRTVRTDRGNAIAEVAVEHHEWYAPGVGLVKATRSETADSPFLKAGHYAQELVQYE